MTTDELVKDALTAVADDASLPTGVAHAAWRRRTRMRIRRAATTAAALAAAVTVGVITVPPLVERDAPEVANSVTVDDVAADPGHPLPQHRVAAGRLTLTAYAACDPKCSWFMLTHAGAGGYTRGPWGWVDVAPSGRTAAVLDDKLPARRIGLVDTTAASVRRWIDLGRAVAGSVAWSPDGKRLLVTTYNFDPGLIDHPGDVADERDSRTGFAIVDVKSGKATFHSLPATPDAAGRDDLSWSRDGSLIWEMTGERQRPRKYYDLTGRSRPGPAQESSSDQPAGLSPDGRHLAMGGRSGSAPFVVDVDSGDTTLLEPGGHAIVQLLAWADDTHLIAWAQETGGRSRYRLVLVGVTGAQKVTPLTGWTDPLVRSSWRPVFTAVP